MARDNACERASTLPNTNQHHNASHRNAEHLVSRFKTKPKLHQHCNTRELSRHGSTTMTKNLITMSLFSFIPLHASTILQLPYPDPTMLWAPW
eukprot:5047957-Amphidinium_carterae.2